VSEGGKSYARGGFVEADHIFVGSEKADLAFIVLVGFHALETLEGVVEDAGCWVKGEVLVRNNLGGKPTVGCGPFY